PCQRRKRQFQLRYREERLARFRRCCRFRSFHLAFWLLLSFARDALVHLNAIGCSLAPAAASIPTCWLANVKGWGLLQFPKPHHRCLAPPPSGAFLFWKEAGRF